MQDRVVPVDDAVVIGGEGGVTGDATVVRDAFVEPELDASGLDVFVLDAVAVRDTGVATDSGVRADTGVATDSGVRPDAGRDAGVILDSGTGGCAAGQIFCGGTCLLSNELNCGICGVRCGMGLVCVAHSCVSCPFGQMACSDGSGNRCCASACGAGLVCAAVD